MTQALARRARGLSAKQQTYGFFPLILGALGYATYKGGSALGEWWESDSHYYVTKYGRVFRVRMTDGEPTLHYLYDARTGTAYSEGDWSRKGAGLDEVKNNVVEGGAYDDYEVAKRRADTLVAEARAAGGGGAPVGGAPAGGGAPSPDGAPSAISAPDTVNPPSKKKLWEKPWFLALAGTVVVGGVGFGVWRYARAKAPR